MIQPDTDADGLGDACDPLSADGTGDGIVGGPDFIILSGQFGSTTGGSADFTGDGIVGGPDFLLLSDQFGEFQASQEFGDLSGPQVCPGPQLP